MLCFIPCLRRLPEAEPDPGRDRRQVPETSGPRGGGRHQVSPRPQEGLAEDETGGGDSCIDKQLEWRP